MKCPCTEFKSYEKCGHSGCYDAGMKEGKRQALGKALEAVQRLKGFKGEAKRLLIQALGE